MKKFSFPLDRVLHWRRIQRDREKAEMETLVSEQSALIARAERMRTERLTVERSFAESADIESSLLATLASWQGSVAGTLRSMTVQQRELEARIAKQRQRFQEVQLAVKLLERLREKRLDTWRNDMLREEEAFAAEAYLARCIRLKE